MTSPLKSYIITEPRIENTRRHQKMLALAKRKAVESNFNGPRMAAIVTKGGRVINWGTNKPQSGSLKSKHYTKNQALHAECDATRGIDPKVLRGATIYVYGFQPCRAQATWSSKPCSSCEALLRDLGIREVIFHNCDEQPHVLRIG